MSQTLSTALFYREGSSDKQYNVQLQNKNDGFVVNFQYGRRGSALKSGTKTAEPVAYDAAHKIYTKLVNSKVAEGYTEDANGAVHSMTIGSNEYSGHRPQLLNAISESDVENLLDDPEWGMQEKFDGERRGLHQSEESLLATNKKGLYVGVKDTFASVIQELGFSNLQLDGEDLGDRFVAFDVLVVGERTLRDTPYIERHGVLRDLEVLLTIAGLDNVMSVAELARTSEQKRQLFSEIKSRNGEGVVFRRLSAPYSADRPNSGGDVLKFKFLADATVLVTGHNVGKRSVAIAVKNEDGELISVGNVTIPSNKSIPPLNSFIDVQYLYAYRGGALFQPQFKGERNDQDKTDIGIGQLKFVNGDEGRDAA